MPYHFQSYPPYEGPPVVIHLNRSWLTDCPWNKPPSYWGSLSGNPKPPRGTAHLAHLLRVVDVQELSGPVPMPCAAQWLNHCIDLCKPCLPCFFTISWTDTLLQVIPMYISTYICNISSDVQSDIRPGMSLLLLTMHLIYLFWHLIWNSIRYV